MSEHSFPFSHAERGMTRFPPNVESIAVERDACNVVRGDFIEDRVALVVRRNDVTLRFPLTADDCRHLMGLLDPGPVRRSLETVAP